MRYLQRLYTEEWVRVVQELRSDLDIDLVRTMCQGAIATIQSATEFHNRLPRSVVGPTLGRMAMHALIGTPVASLPIPRTVNGRVTGRQGRAESDSGDAANPDETELPARARRTG